MLLELANADTDAENGATQTAVRASEKKRASGAGSALDKASDIQ